MPDTLLTRWQKWGRQRRLTRAGEYAANGLWNFYGPEEVDRVKVVFSRLVNDADQTVPF
jgi:hypothetical protein